MLRLIAVWLLLAGPAAAQGCVRPAAEALMPGGPYPELASRMLRQGPMQWMAVTWFGPMDGRLFALDCAGKPMGAPIAAGHVRTMKPGPVLPGVGATLLAEATVGTGTGYREDAARLVAVVDGAAKLLWEHPTLRADTAQARFAKEEKWAVAVGRDGRLTVTGSRTEAGKPRAALPVERFCWDAAAGAFAGC
jgi:hypothetical protein